MIKIIGVEMLKLHQVLPVRFDSGGSPEVTLSFMVCVCITLN